MKFYSLIILLIASCQSPDNAGNEHIIAKQNDDTSNTATHDTLIKSSAIKIYQDDYIVIHLQENENFARRVEIIKNGIKIASFNTPVPDDEVKNFRVLNIKATKNGFNMEMSYGGGNDLYNSTHTFEFIEAELYLTVVKSTHYNTSVESISTDTLALPLVITKYVLTDYLFQ